MIDKIVEDTAVELIRIAATELPLEYVEEMDRLMRETDGSVGKSQMANILENVRIAREGSKPMCQDTGVVAFMAKVGDGFPLRSRLKDVLVEATKRATREVPLRPNAVDMFKGNTGNNSLGCPPYFVGVGIGGGEDVCMKLAKNALLRPFKVRNPDPRVAEIEEELMAKLNELGIGAMGLGEGPSVLDVHVEMAARHPASLPVGVVISCWALRHAKATISAAGRVEIDKSA
jgi:fumarate hydratase subunit alpha